MSSRLRCGMSRASLRADVNAKPVGRKATCGTLIAVSFGDTLTGDGSRDRATRVMEFWTTRFVVLLDPDLVSIFFSKALSLIVFPRVAVDLLGVIGVSDLVGCGTKLFRPLESLWDLPVRVRLRAPGDSCDTVSNIAAIAFTAPLTALEVDLCGRVWSGIFGKGLVAVMAFSLTSELLGFELSGLGDFSKMFFFSGDRVLGFLLSSFFLFSICRFHTGVAGLLAPWNVDPSLWRVEPSTEGRTNRLSLNDVAEDAGLFFRSSCHSVAGVNFLANP